jgi:pyrroloquinoline quinone biosynthesis protein B
VRLRVLGTAAGGGVPQWNCDCPGCAGARRYPDRQRSQASLAVQVGEQQWLVVNAGPDIGAQIESCPELRPGPGRRSPVSGVVLTDAELDHTLGLLQLRTAPSLEIHATAAVLNAVKDELGLQRILGSYAGLTWSALAEQSVVVGAVEISAVGVAPKRPRYAVSSTADAVGAWVSALRITDRATRATAIYAPCVAVWSAGLEAAINEADCIFLDGTFWDDDEPIRAGFSARTATGMGHLPITETAPRLAKTHARRRFYTHLNNSNPLVDPEAAEHRTLADLSLEVATEKAVIDL